MLLISEWPLPVLLLTYELFVKFPRPDAEQGDRVAQWARSMQPGSIHHNTKEKSSCGNGVLKNREKNEVDFTEPDILIQVLYNEHKYISSLRNQQPFILS